MSWIKGGLQSVGDLQKQLRGVAQLVAHLVWDQGVAGSNPVTPTIQEISQLNLRDFLLYNGMVQVYKK